MADYNANIRVSADTKKAESEISKLQSTLNKLSDFTLKLNSRDIGRQVNAVSQQLRGIGERGAVGAITLAAGKATTALSVLGAKLGIVGAAAAAAGSTINSSLGGIPGVITDILNHLGNVPTAFGVAAVAAMAFAPQLTKAAAGAAGLGAALDKAVGGKTSQKIATLVDGIGQLNVELEATKAAFSSLIEGSTLNELNAQLRDAVTQSGAFHSSTEDAVTAAKQLVAVQREQAREQRAINDLIRKAQGLQPQDVRNTEVSRRVSALKTRELQQKRDAQLQNQINAELAEYERLAEQVAAQTKRWADNLERVARSGRAGVLGSSSQIRARLEEMRQNRNSADIARQRSAELLALEARQRGGNYSLSQVPARGELFPGGNSLTASPQYRGMLNAQAQMRQAAASALAQSERTVLGFQAQTLRTEKDITASKVQQQAIDQRSIQIARERNKLLLEQYRAEQRVASGTLDRASRVADLRRRKEAGKNMAAQGENLALGVGFPLLFGGGAGSVLGAAAGSFVGSGFGGQILGGAIGQIVDQFVTATTDLGKALLNTSRIFDTLKEASLISSRGLEKTIDRLQEAGFAATASATAQRDFAQVVGRDGARNLLALGDAADRGSRAFAEAVTRFQSRIAGPLGTAQGFLARGGEISNLQNRVGDVAGQLQRSGRNREAQQLLAAASPFGSVGKSQDQVIAELQAALKKAEQSLPPLKIRLDAKQIRDELLTTLNKQLEALDLGRGITQQLRERVRAQEDFDLQRADLVMQQERAIGDLRRSIEDRIVDIRLSNVQRENELLDTQAQIRLQSLKNSNIGLRSGFTNSQVSGAANAVADYLEAELQVANDSAKIKRDAALEVQRLDIETERFKIQTAIQVSRLNQDTAKQVASIQRTVLRQNQDQDARRFQLEKQIADLRLETLQEELTAQVRAAVGTGRDDLLTLSQGSLTRVKQARASLAEVKPPTPLSFNSSGIGGVGVSTGGLESVSAQGRKLAQDLAAAKQALNDLVSSGNYETLKARLTEALDTPLQKSISDAQLLWDELTGGGQGLSTEASQRNAGLQDLLTQLDQLKNRVPAGRSDITGLIEQFAKQAPALTETNATLQVTTELLGGLQDKYRELTDELQAMSMPYGELTNAQRTRNELLRQGIDLESGYAREVLRQAAAVDALQQQVRLATHLQTAWEGVGGAMAEAMTMGVSSVVSGTNTAQQVFAQFLQGVGQALLNVAQQMIATYIAIGVAKIFAGFGGAASGGGPNPGGIPSTGNISAPSINGFDTGALANIAAKGAFFTDSISAFAKGGMFSNSVVNSPTLFRFKNGGATQTGVMGEAGPEAIMPLKRNTDGRLGVDAYGLREAMGRGSAGNSAPVFNMSFQTTNIGGVEYVSRDQLEAAMAETRRQAANDGAKRGMSMTLDKLQQSPGTRNRVGLR